MTQMSEEMTFASLPTAEEVPQPKPYGAWATISMGIAICVFALLAIPLLVSVVFQAIEFAFNTNPVSNGMVVMLSTIATGISGLLLMYMIVRTNGNSSLVRYIELKRLNWKTIFLALAVFIIVLVCITSINILYGFLVGDSANSANSSFMDDAFGGAGWFPVFLATVIFAPVFEEVLFRGFLFVGLQRSRLRVAGTIVFTSLVWAMAHLQYNWFGMVSIGVMGIILGITRHKTGSLWCPIIVHAMWNSMALISTALG